VTWAYTTWDGPASRSSTRRTIIPRVCWRGWCRGCCSNRCSPIPRQCAISAYPLAHPMQGSSLSRCGRSGSTARLHAQPVRRRRDRHPRRGHQLDQLRPLRFAVLPSHAPVLAARSAGAPGGGGAAVTVQPEVLRRVEQPKAVRTPDLRRSPAHTLASVPHTPSDTDTYHLSRNTR
jgi:hypothetical protein